MKIIKHELDGKAIAVTDETVYLIQVGFKSKGAYKTRFTVVGNLPQALLLYKGINVGNGYKKRLISYNLNNPLLARQFTSNS